MTAFVIDASVSAPWCFADERTDYTVAVQKAIRPASSLVMTPRLWPYEIRKLVLKGIRRGRVSRDGAEEFLASLQELRTQTRDPFSYDDLFHLAVRHHLSVYDAAYLNLALREHLSLATLDQALLSAAEQAGVALFRH